MEHINADFGEQWFTYPRLYRMMVENCRPDGTIVELGAWKGRSSAFLVVEAKNKSPNIKIHIVLAGHDYIHAWPGVIQAVNESISGFSTMEQCWFKQC